MQQLKRQRQQQWQQKRQQQQMRIKWKEGNPVPVRRMGHSAVELNGIVYVGGGDEDVLNKPSYKIDTYNTVTESWGPQVNTPCCYFSMTCFGGYLTIVGGEDQRNVISDRVLKLDIKDNTLTHYNPIQQLNTPRSLATAVGYNNFLIVIGGTGEKKKSGEGKRLASTEVYSSVTKRWRNCDNIPKALFNLKPVIVYNELYLLGGYDQSGASPKVFVALLDTLRGHKLRWREFTTTPHLESAPVFLHTYLLALGGSKENSPTSDIAFLNKDGCWEVMGSIPSARIAPAAVCVGSSVVLTGGQDDNKKLTNTVWIGTCAEPHVQ